MLISNIVSPSSCTTAVFSQYILTSLVNIKSNHGFKTRGKWVHGHNTRHRAKLDVPRRWKTASEHQQPITRTDWSGIRSTRADEPSTQLGDFLGKNNWPPTPQSNAWPKGSLVFCESFKFYIPLTQSIPKWVDDKVTGNGITNNGVIYMCVSQRPVRNSNMLKLGSGSNWTDHHFGIDTLSPKKNTKYYNRIVEVYCRTYYGRSVLL